MVALTIKRGGLDSGYFAAGGVGLQMVDELNDRPMEEGGLKKGGELGGREVQAKMNVETEQGFSGFVPDPTPNANYTVAGVTSGAPTPENNPQAAAEAGSSKFVQANIEPAKPVEKVTLKNSEGREIRVSPKLASSYPEYKGGKEAKK